MSATETGVLAVAGALTVGTAAEQWRRLLPRLDGAACIDLSAVDAIDSAGLALLQALRRRAGRRLVLRGAPPHLTQLCVAHRVAIDGD